MPVDNNILFLASNTQWPHSEFSVRYRQVCGLLRMCMLAQFFNEKQGWITDGQFDDFFMIITIEVCWLVNVYSAVHVMIKKIS